MTACCFLQIQLKGKLGRRSMRPFHTPGLIRRAQLALGLALPVISLVIPTFATRTTAAGADSALVIKPVTTNKLPNSPGNDLTAVVVELAPGAQAAKHHHAGFVFAYVLSGTIRSQLNGGVVKDYAAGQSWVEPPGTEHTLTENPSKVSPARLLAVFVAPEGAQLTKFEK
jgi:quercetin dioxygenase-like cupin family protein